MLVSVVMPMRNAAPFVRAAISSLLSTDSIEIEVVVVDDGSTDKSRSIVHEINDSRIKLIDGPRSGIADCLNAGLRSARGDVIMRCDADDTYPPGRIEFQCGLLSQRPEVAAVCGGFEMMDSSEQLVATLYSPADEPRDISSELRDGHLRTHLCTFAIRRSTVQAVGEFRRYFETAEDIDYALRIGVIGPVAFVARNFYNYRIHNNSITHSLASVRREFFDSTATRFALQRKTIGVDDLMRGDPPLPPENSGPAGSASDHLFGMYVGQAWRYVASRQRAEALTLGLKVLSTWPFRLKAWILFLKLLVKSATSRKRFGRTSDPRPPDP